MQNVVLVKKADPISIPAMIPKDTFVPLPSNPPTLQVPSTTKAATTTPSTTPTTSTSYPMTTTSASAYITPVTSFQTSTSQGSPIVVLSRQRFSPPSIFVTPPGGAPKPPSSSSSTTTPRPRSSQALIDHTKSPPPLISSTGVPASGDIPKSWTINNYDPRRNRISIVEDNDHQLFFPSSLVGSSPTGSAAPMMDVSSAISRPTFVTPLPSFKPKKEELIKVHHSPAPSTATEAMISRLRKDYKKRRQLIEKSASLRRSDFAGPTVVPKSTASTTTMTMTSSTPAEYTKGPSIRFEAEEAEDRYFVVSPNHHVPSSNYQVVDHQAVAESTTPHTTSYLPPITTESHAYKEVHYVEKQSPATTTASTYTTKASTVPTLTPRTLPTSLTPPYASGAGGQVYVVRPTVPSSSTTLITTQGALLLPKNPQVPTFVTPIHSTSSFPLENSLYESRGKSYGPPIIVVQQAANEAATEKLDMGQEEKTEAPPITTTPMSLTTDTTTTTEDSSIVFPMTRVDDDDADTTLASLVSNYDEMEITERITGGNNGQVVFNDTQTKNGVQQSINLKINVIVENSSDSNEETEEEYDDDLYDSVPKATSTSPSIPRKNKANYIKKVLPPLAYTSSSSFRSEIAPGIAPPPATSNDYMYDSELDMLDYYYYDYQVPSVSDDVTKQQSLEKEEKVEITDKELFELYDDLSEILEDMETSLASTPPKSKPKWPPQIKQQQLKPSVKDEKQNIYEFIRSKPLKMKPKKTRYNSSPIMKNTNDGYRSQEIQVAKPKPFKDPRKKQRRKRRRRRKKNFLKLDQQEYFHPMGSVKSYYGGGGHISSHIPASSPNQYYNLTGDLIPDLREVSKPSNWNVRDFTPWEEIFFPRLGVMPITPEFDQDDQARPEKHRKAVTFDKLLKTNPNQQRLSKFSRLIRHDNRRSRSDDDYYQVEPREPREEPWTQYSHYTRVPRDDSSFFREDDYYHHPLPSFDISFDEWLAEAGVVTSSSSSKLRHFRNQKPFWNNPEGVLHR